jgi:hypothetical protein
MNRREDNGNTRIDNVLHLLAVLEIKRNGQGILLVALHAHYALMRRRQKNQKVPNSEGF